MKNFFEILEKYKILNPNREIEGYSDEEIKRVEELYDIEIKGDFKKFMKIAGSSSGNLLGDNIMSIYAPKYDTSSYLILNYFFFKEKKLEYLLKFKPFIFSIEYDNYSFIKTIDNDLIIYNYDETANKVFSLNCSFNDYMVDLIERYNPELLPLVEKNISLKILPKYDKNSGKEIYPEEIKKYIEENNKTEDDFIWILEKYLRQNNKTSVGYSEIEIEEIEKLYDLKIEDKFREFMRFAGRSSGGLLTGNELVFYKNWSVREQWLYLNNFMWKLISDVTNLDGNFVLKQENNNYIHMETKNEGLKIYNYDEFEDKVIDMNINFNEYLVNLVKKYNPNLKPLENGSLKGELIKID